MIDYPFLDMPRGEMRVRALELEAAARYDEAIVLWRGLLTARFNMGAYQRILRCWERLGDHESALATAEEVIELLPQRSTISTSECIVLRSIIRSYVGHCRKQNKYDKLCALREIIIKSADNFFHRAWPLYLTAIVLEGSHAVVLAEEYFRRAAAFVESETALFVDIVTDLFLLLAKRGRYGRAIDVFSLLPQGEISPKYSAKAEFVRKVYHQFSGAKEEILYPECVIDRLVAESRPSRRINSRQILMFVPSLGPGGLERDAISLAGALRAGRFGLKVGLAVRSSFSSPGRATHFLDLAQAAFDDVISVRDEEVASDNPITNGDDRKQYESLLPLLPEQLRKEIIQILHILTRLKPRVVDCFGENVPTIVAALIAGTPRIIVRRGNISFARMTFTEEEVECRNRPLARLLCRLLGTKRLVFANNSDVAVQEDLTFFDAPKDALAVTYRQIVGGQLFDLTGIAPAELRKRLGIPTTSDIVGAVFRFVAAKRPMLWLEMATLIAQARPSLHFVMVGDGPLFEQAQNLVQRSPLSGRIHLVGRVRNPRDWYRVMDVCVLTSKREGRPNVLLEAQYCGVPIVAPDVGGVRDCMIPDITGKLVAGSDPASFADCVLEILRDQHWRIEAKRQAPDFIRRKFGADAAVRQALEIYCVDPAMRHESF